METIEIVKVDGKTYAKVPEILRDSCKGVSF